MWGCRGVGMGQRHRVPFPVLGVAGARPEPGTWGLAPPGRKVAEILPQLPVTDRAAGWGHAACTARQHRGVQPGTAPGALQGVTGVRGHRITSGTFLRCPDSKARVAMGPDHGNELTEQNQAVGVNYSLKSSITP